MLKLQIDVSAYYTPQKPQHIVTCLLLPEHKLMNAEEIKTSKVWIGQTHELVTEWEYAVMLKQECSLPIA